MSKTEELKKYLLGSSGKKGYLLNDMHNGKTIMLSGAWGSGKTHFWQEEIVKEQKEIEIKGNIKNKYDDNEYKQGLAYKLKSKNKACVYVSLYGKDNIEFLKNEIVFKAYESIKDENILAKRAISAFGFGSRLLSVSVGGVRVNTSTVGDGVEGFFEGRKINDAESFLADGGLICFDDFERKSKHIDLNDLFGFIAQLAIDMNCKIVIILNSDIFEGEEANKFVEVKEKTINKFFHFEPTPKELFESVFNIQDSQEKKKYELLKPYYEDILSAIIETKELNARIYIQVLDNCLEWIDGKNDNSVLHVLTLATTFFIKNHEVLDFIIVQKDKKQHNIVTYFLDEGYYDIANFLQNTAPQLFSSDNSCACKESMQMMNSHLNKSKKEDKEVRSDDYYKRQNKIFDENKNFFRDFIYYIYVLKIDERVSQDIFEKINKFIKTGILPKQTKEVESSLPPEAVEEINA